MTNSLDVGLMDLSIIIPAYDEANKIARDIKAASEFLIANHFLGEIIVVDDGSTDDTANIARKAGNDLPKCVSLQVITLDPHRGKGCAVKTGIVKSSGQYVMFADSGCCVPYGNALLGLEMLKSGRCDIAHGSRRMVRSDVHKDQPCYRRICAKCFKWFVHHLLTIPHALTDTQCGFKVYRGDVARELYSQSIIDGFMFDVEIILLAQKRRFRIEEFPVEWSCDPDSRLSLARTPWPVLSELIRIKRRLNGK
jgi:dolichyl-phosphate beta-glucosyltransferase